MSFISSSPETMPLAVGYRLGTKRPAPSDRRRTLEAMADQQELLDLVRRAQRADEAAQRTLIVTYQSRIAGFVYAMIGHGDAVDDLTQQVMIKMLRSLHTLQSATQFEPWFFRLARNNCIDFLRRCKIRRIFLPLLDEHDQISEPAGAVDSEELDALRYALAQLRPEERALLALVQEGRSHDEIATILSTTVAAVKARLHRARLRLSEYYEPASRRSSRR